ncbi:MAG: ParB/RepB/Spo0J family partition protein [Bacteroidales bacterium]|nr:ParB/RepB/Spo0J family partition protein [Bacteroidales bacterium]
MTVKKKFALGRGLDALISTDEISTSGSSSINEVELDKIQANPNQPRREFNQEALRELADSIKEIGIIQPITLRRMDDDSYQIIAGERRYRASLLAGMATIPAYIKTADDENVMEMALIENIQREDLNSLEIALAYQHLLEQYNLTQERLSDRVGKKRTTVANYLRLLKLPAPIQVALKNKEIDMGHARSLLALSNPKDQIRLFNDIKKNNYSVRKVEELVKAILNKAEAKHDGSLSPAKSATTFDSYKKRISDCLGSPIKLSYNDCGKGKISIPFANEVELQKIVTLLENIKQS